MKTYKLNILITLFGIFSMTLYSQEKCKVLKKDISGEYKGDCKNGLANGKGLSIGINKYEGHFKKGLPDGLGSMIYANGGRYTGNWRKGLRHGEGKYIFSLDSKDSIANGLWRKDIFKGEKPKKQYEVIYKRSVPRYTIRKLSNEFNRVTIKVKNSGMLVRTPSNITGSSGNYFNYQSNVGYENIIQFPFRCEMKYSMATKLGASRTSVDFVFNILEPGDWLVELLH